MFDVTRSTTPRRGFIGRLAAAMALGVTGLTPLRLEAQSEAPRTSGASPEFEAWLNKITGKHKMVFDTNNENYATTDAQNSAVIVLRHGAIPIAMQDAMWAKYKLGEVFKLNDGTAPATRNTFAKPILLPGTGVEQLLVKGVLIGVCNVALTVYSGAVAQNMNLDAAQIKQDWIANLFPGIVVVPSGVLAVSRAQEKGCAYCFAG